MSRIERMQRGRLTEEYRHREVDGEVRQSGPFFKHQVWSGGKNFSRRVKAEEAQQLRDDIAGLDRFKELSAQYIETTVAMTNETGDAEGKKTPGRLAGTRFGETARFVQSATSRLSEEGASNTYWLELGLRAALMADATEIMEALINSADLPVAQDAKRPGERYAGRQSKEVQTLFGTILPQWFTELLRPDFVLPKSVDIPSRKWLS